MWWLKQIFSPLNYLRIKVNGIHIYKSKFFLDCILPIAISAILLLTEYIFRQKIPLVGAGSIGSAVADLLKLFVAFFIAALAAVSTLARDSLDDNLRGTPAYLGDRELTQRQYISLLFGYLSLLSFMFIFAVIIIDVTKDLRFFELNANVYELVVCAARFLFWLLLSNLIITTLLGIHFLSDNIHADEND